MSKKRECIEETKKITGLAPERNAIESAKRWIEKANKNPTKGLNYQIDKFFSLYVAYNIIYSLISHEENWDRCSAVSVIACYIKTNKIIVFSSSKSEIEDMIKPIRNHEIFHIYENDKNHDDSKLISNIDNNLDIEESVLNLLYGIRCNMFHGKKELSNEQLSLLIPANKILENLVNSLIESLTRGWSAA
jgi:hypothetical protein